MVSAAMSILPMHDRLSLGAHIASRLSQEAARLKQQFASEALPHFVLDELLPEEVVHEIYRAFPSPEAMVFKQTLREQKYISAQMNTHAPILEEIVYAFQTPEVVAMIASITGLQALEPDAQLYAGGISVMNQGCFLNPHIDNSHDKDRQRYRVLNLLYYVSPNWTRECSGNLELWPLGLKKAPVEIVSKANRLVCMLTDQRSFHSVNIVRVSQNRCCVSNYYFSERAPQGNDYFHVTTFRGRPEEPLRNIALTLDGWLRMGLRKLRSRGVAPVTHFYKQ